MPCSLSGFKWDPQRSQRWNQDAQREEGMNATSARDYYVMSRRDLRRIVKNWEGFMTKILTFEDVHSNDFEMLQVMCISLRLNIFL